MGKDCLSQKLVLMQKSLDFYEQILEHLPVVLCIHTFTGQQIVSSLVNNWCNQFALDTIGYTRNEIKAMGFDFFVRIIHPADLDLLLNQLNQCPQRSTHTQIFQYRLRPKHQTDYHLMVGQGIPLDYHADGSGKTILHVMLDLTAQLDHDSPLQLVLKQSRRLKNEWQCHALTKRETEILGSIASGLTDHEIGDKFFISFATAKTHRNKILKKLGLKNTASLVAFAVECGLV